MNILAILATFAVRAERAQAVYVELSSPQSAIASRAVAGVRATLAGFLCS